MAKKTTKTSSNKTVVEADSKPSAKKATKAKTVSTAKSNETIAKLELNSKLKSQLVAEIKSELVAELKGELITAIKAELATAFNAQINSLPRAVDITGTTKGIPEISSAESGTASTGEIGTKANFVNKAPAWLVAVEAEKISRHRELRGQYFHAKEVFEKHRARLMALPEVTGLHIGFRRKNGTIVFPLEYCIRVSVQKKRDARDPRVVNLLEPEIEGIRVDISERSFEILAEEHSASVTASIASASTSKPFDNTIFDPIRGGIVIANENSLDNWGTLGIILKTTNGGKVCLTCKHVASTQKPDDTTTPPADVILQPTISNGADPKRAIGRVRDAVRNAFVDAAIVGIDAGIRSQREIIVGPNRGFLNASLINGTAIEGRLAFLVGATSDPGKLVLGRIQSIDAEVEIKNFGTMFKQIIVEKIFDPADPTPPELIRGGDSGSVLLMQTSINDVFAIVGLVHAGTVDKGYVVASHWHHIATAFPELMF